MPDALEGIRVLELASYLAGPYAGLFDRSTAGKDITINDLKAFLVRACLGKPGDNFESMPNWRVWVRNRQVVSMNGTIWDYTDSLDRLGALQAPVLAAKHSRTETTEHLAQIVEDVAATVPNGRLPHGESFTLENFAPSTRALS